MEDQTQTRGQRWLGRFFSVGAFLFCLANFIVLVSSMEYRYYMKLALSVFVCGMLVIAAHEIIRLSKAYRKNEAIALWKRRWAVWSPRCSRVIVDMFWYIIMTITGHFCAAL